MKGFIHFMTTIDDDYIYRMSNRTIDGLYREETRMVYRLCSSILLLSLFLWLTITSLMIPNDVTLSYLRETMWVVVCIMQVLEVRLRWLKRKYIKELIEQKRL